MTEKISKILSTKIDQKIVYIVNIICGLMIFWVSVKSPAFATVFYSLVFASQAVFWGVRKLRDDKKWLGYYSYVGIMMVVSSLIPLYLAFFSVLNYPSIDAYLSVVGWKGVPDIIKIAFHLKR